MSEIKMTQEELKEFQEFQAEKKKRAAEELRRQQREEYANMVDDEVAKAVNKLSLLSEKIKEVKQEVYSDFNTILEMKREVIGVKNGGQLSHTFTTSDSQFRLILGVNTIDDYRDTVEDGVAMVKGYIETLATDDKTKQLVGAVLRLLSRDGRGNIKPSRVLQLRKMAEEVGDASFIEGVKIIEESYQPTESKTYIRAEVKDKNGGWKIIPLSVTDV